MKINLLKWFGKSDMIYPSTRIFRKQIIEGFSIPAIIRNGSYFFVDIDVYENGRVECWNFEDFEHFKERVKKGWIVLNIPDNEQISIHGLGTWTISNSEWIFDKGSFVAYVLDLIKELNPQMENIFKYTSKKMNGITIGENGKGTIYKEYKKNSNDFFPKKINGESTNLFYRTDDEYHLVKINVFKDDTIQISRLKSPIALSFTELEELVIRKIISTEVPNNATVHIYGLGKFTIEKKSYNTNIKDKLLEIEDIQRKLKGQPSTIEICRQLFQLYKEHPTLENKEKLKTSYENIPDHQKMYVGDMDTKDVEVRMIIYGEKEIEKWSHHQLAKKMGEQLPTINIPKPTDERDSS